MVKLLILAGNITFIHQLKKISKIFYLLLFLFFSVAGIQAYKGGSVYCASKHAIQAVTNSLRKEVVDKNIRVTSICPGLVETEFSVVRFDGDKNKADSVYNGIAPLVSLKMHCQISKIC